MTTTTTASARHIPPVARESVLGTDLPVFTDRDRSLGQILERSRAHGDRVYLVCDHTRITFTDHHRMVAATARVLRERYGVRRGDRVAILGSNSAEWIVTFWATVAMGAVAVAMNSHWSAHEIERARRQVRPAVIVADRKRIDELGRIEDAAGDPDPVPVLGMDVELAEICAGARTADGADDDVPELLSGDGIDEDDPAAIVFTSGTTGRPKGAVHSHRNFIAARDFYRYLDAQAGPLDHERRYLMTGPLFHIAALHNIAVPRLATGETVVVYTGRFAADRVLALIAREGVTHWTGVPTMGYRLIVDGNSGGHDLSSLRSFSLGAAATPPAMRAQLRALLPGATAAMVATYGQTECSTAATIASPRQLEADPRTVGSAAVNTEIRVCDDSGAVVPDGTEGEVQVRSAGVMLGYWDDPAATAAALDDHRWLRTGDIGVLRDGELTIVARRSDLIIRGGENVYPAEIEHVLDTHPAVVESIVYGRDSAEYGQEVAATVVLQAPDAVAVDELRAYVRGRVAAYKVPSNWTLQTDPLPKNATGKVVRGGFR